MNKHELVSHVAAGTPVTRDDAECLVGVVFSAIADALARGEPVAIAASTTPSFKPAQARSGRNPRTGESIVIAASTAPSFKAGKPLLDAVR